MRGWLCAMLRIYIYMYIHIPYLGRLLGTHLTLPRYSTIPRCVSDPLAPFII
jgi:hypothetical protein